MANAKARRQAQDSDAGQLAAKGKSVTEIARLLGTSPAKVYRTLEVAEGLDPTPYKGTES